MINRKSFVALNGGILEGWIPLVERVEPGRGDMRGFSFKHRYLMNGAESALTAYLSPESPRHGDRTLLPLAEKALNLLIATLDGEGLCHSTNLSSPPDTAFVTERAGALLILLRKRGEEIPRSPETASLLTDYLERTCDALLTGGVHTPNHRWVVSSALSYGYFLLGKKGYRRRAEEWLAEGIDLDGDGQFCERSTSIYSPVSVHCLLNVAEYLGREDLYAGIGRHLTMNLAHFTPGGDLLTQSSRRQDAYMPGHPGGYWLPYRIMALRERKGEFARAALFLEEKERFPRGGLTELLSGRGEGDLPEPAGSLPLPGDRYLASSGLFRSSEGDRFYALFAGADREDPFRQTSGLANHPTFLTFQEGPCLLESVRLGYMFFSTGYFRADTMEVAGGTCRLSRTLSVPYFDRLPGEWLRPDGGYDLTSTGRYWSKMAFPRRDRVNERELTTTVEVGKTGTGLELTIRSESGTPVPAALEFQFPREGELRGDWAEQGGASLFGPPLPDLPENVKILSRGRLTYSRGGKSITIGEGRCEHDWLPCHQEGDFVPLEREMRDKRIVYLTFYSPFEIKVTIEGS